MCVYFKIFTIINFYNGKTHALVVDLNELFLLSVIKHSKLTMNFLSAHLFRNVSLNILPKSIHMSCIFCCYTDNASLQTELNLCFQNKVVTNKIKRKKTENLV